MTTIEEMGELLAKLDRDVADARTKLWDLVNNVQTYPVEPDVPWIKFVSKPKHTSRTYRCAARTNGNWYVTGFIKAYSWQELVDYMRSGETTVFHTLENHGKVIEL